MMTASAVSLDGSKSVVVENVGHFGATLRGRNLPDVGHDVLVWMNDFDVMGSIAWSNFDLRGIVFDAPIDERALERLAG